MSNAVQEINRDLHRCKQRLSKSVRGNRHQFRIDRNRKLRTRMERDWAAYQIKAMA